MIRELLLLIKLLFTKVKDLVEILQLKYFPFKGFSAMFWCGKIITRDNYLPPKVINHELIHCQLALVKGSWFKYYLSYLVLYFKHLSTPMVMYYTNPYEMEAYANESDMNYTKSYDPKSISKYKVKNIVQIFKLLSNIQNWIKYIRTL